MAAEDGTVTQDIAEIRAMAIAMGELTGLDEVRTFYHDETNNIRKLRIDERGFNVDTLKTFVLGGVSHAGPPRPLDMARLRKALATPAAVAELKVDNIAKGDFTRLIASPRLAIVLDWVRDQGLVWHYSELDPLYWSIVDIIDSILPESGNPMLFMAASRIKSDLHLILSQNIPAVVDLFYRHDYPGLAPGTHRAFLNELRALVRDHLDILPHFEGMMLKGIVEMGRSLEGLEFVEDNAPHLLIAEFSAFYTQRIALFRNAHHILDMEPVIRAQFERLPLSANGVPVTNYRFADSKTEAGIQIADIVTGLLGKMHSFVAEQPREAIIAFRDELPADALANLDRIRDALTLSDRANRAFIHHVASLHDIDKLDLLLRFGHGLYAGGGAPAFRL
ncbi:hypothetical protein FHS96_005550 [Sphingomonas zeicaulis]|uniref:DUF3800 domain-containing protein n=1 Tax=Sphingomonas zeicaulis TaxID=1632740 RepID=UPI003D24F0A0